MPAPVATSVAPQLRMVVMRLARKLRQQAEGSLSPSQLSALSSVDRMGATTLGELASIEQVKPPTMTKIVGNLEEAGLVRREPDAGDRRVVRVHITEAGRRHVATSRTRRDAYLAERLRRLDPDERALLERALPLLERLVEGDQ
jgi:DNA-binding MarR family transcriptional regulator